MQNLVALQHVYGYKYAWGTQEYTEDTIGMSKVSYLLVISHIYRAKLKLKTVVIGFIYSKPVGLG